MNNRVDIQFKGLTTSPSDYACSDGELAICHNLVNDGGELRPIMPPKFAFNLPSGSRLIYIHRTQSASMAIYGDGSDLYASSIDALTKDGASAESTNVASLPFTQIKSVNSIGNMLIISTASDTRYYKYYNGTYVYLGDKFPDLPKVQFGMYVLPDAGQFIGGSLWIPSTSAKDFEGKVFDGVSEESYATSLSAGGGSTFYNNLMSALEFSQKACETAGGFCYPFFVRYAFRLFDGTTYKVSAPVLMTPLDRLPTIKVWASSNKHKVFSSTFLSYLTYRILDTNFGLSQWSDVIESIDVYVSRPVYTWHTGLSMDGYVNSIGVARPWCLSPLYYDTGVATPPPITQRALRPNNYYGSTGDYGHDFESYRRTTETLSNTQPGVGEYAFNGYFCPSFKSRSEMVSDLTEVGDFYHVASIPFSEAYEISLGFERVPIDKGALSVLTSREYLKEDYLTNYEVTGSKTLVYNSRLIKIGERRDMRTKFTLDVMTQYLHSNLSIGAPTCFVRLNKAGEDYYVPLGSSNEKTLNRGNWLFYPDPDAQELLFAPENDANGRGYYYSVPLKRHEMLQGAYWLPDDVDDVLGYAAFSGGMLAPFETKYLAPIHSQIYVSEANNPFVFPSGLSASVGNGNILALAATTLPISEGQQGQFPVMAFTDEGIWALSVSSTGSLVATNPMLRDVLLSPESLCVIDDGVVYATKEGLRILRGKQSVSITDALKDAFTGGSMLPTNIRALLSNGDGFAPPDEGKAHSWADGCRVIYASALQRLYVLTRGMSWSRNTALVYPLTTGAWSSCAFRYEDRVEAYPTTYVQTGSKVYDINVVEESAKNTNAVVLTRPLTFGARNTPKTIMEAIVRGNIDTRATARTLEGWETDPVTGNKRYGTWKIQSDVNTVLYGSNDLANWFAVGSSASSELRNRAGTPYKYFRLLVLASSGLCAPKSIAGAAFDVQPRLNNTLR